MKIRIALLQFYAARTLDGIKWMERAMKMDPDILLPPEAWTPRTPENDVTEGGEFIRKLKRLAWDNGCHIISGGLVERRRGRRYVSAHAISPEGEIEALFRKLHLFRSEKRRFTPGKEIAMFRARGHKAGIAICYDIDFPETARKYVLSGCELLLVPSKINSHGMPPWEIYVKARVLENRLPVAYSNVADNGDYRGGSGLVQPELTEGGIMYTRTVKMGTAPGARIVETDPSEFRSERVKRLHDRNRLTDGGSRND